MSYCIQFVKFANIEEDTPSYHRRYDFFVSKFSAMCHSGDSKEVRDKIRTAGIKGLQAVVRKTVSDDLVENIWEPVHMDKIVPSLLFNMQVWWVFGFYWWWFNWLMLFKESSFHKETPNTDTIPEDNVDPPMLAETCLRELVGRASFGHIRAVLKPVLRWFWPFFFFHLIRLDCLGILIFISYGFQTSLLSTHSELLCFQYRY